LYDDLDQSTEDIRTVSLSLDGKAVELDLSQKNYDKVAKFLEPYIAAGRKTSSGGGSATRRRSSSATPAKGGDTSAIRAWAEANGYEVNSRGRIKADIVKAYEAAQG
jgi:hypothetical protein